MPTAVVYQRNYNTIFKIYAPDKGIKLSKLGQKKQWSPNEPDAIFVNSYYSRSYDLQKQTLTTVVDLYNDS